MFLFIMTIVSVFYKCIYDVYFFKSMYSEGSDILL